MQTMINRHYLREKKNDVLTTLGCLIVTLILLFLGFYYLAIIPAFFFIAFAANLIRGKKYHKRLMVWLDENPDAQLFIYSSKKQYIDILEHDILPKLDNSVFAVKNDNAKITGDLPRVIYYELHQTMRLKDLPLIISFQGDEYNMESLKKHFDRYKNNDITQTELLTVIVDKMQRHKIGFSFNNSFMTRIKHLETLLSSDNTNNSIIELDNFIGELCAYGDEMETLTEPQQLFYYIQCLEREVNNGGFNQYFINSSGKFAHQTIQSLKRIGANTTANILQKAIDQFPDKKIPQDRDERNELVEQIEATANEVWNELDQQFYQYADDLNTLNLHYVKQHKAFF